MKQVGEVTVEADGSKYSFEGYEVSTLHSYSSFYYVSLTFYFFSVHTSICFWSLSTSQYGIHSYWAARVCRAQSYVGVTNT